MRAGSGSLLAAVALLELSAHRAQAACLQNAVPPADRIGIPDLQSVGEVPFGFWLHEWDSAMLATYVVKLLAEEVLGYNAVINGRGDMPSSGLYATAGCLQPNSFTKDPQCRSPPAFIHHACLEVWRVTNIISMRERLLAAGLPELIPEDAGDMGYLGVDGTHVFSQQKESAFQAEGLALEYYRSYDVAWTRPWKYFDNYTSFDPSDLRPCNDTEYETRFRDDWEIQTYLKVTGDRDGVVVDADGKFSARCWHGSWWLSPACRNNPETCIPSVTGGNGWSMHDFMQKAAVFNMPLALTIGRSWTEYVSLVSQKKTLPYWWQPDSTFIERRPMLLTFPPYNAAERAKGVRTSSQDKTRLSKWVHNKLGLQATTLRSLMFRMSLSMDTINYMLLQLKQQSDATHEQVACDWLRANEKTWRPWIQIRTECASGMGLVDEAGASVMSRRNASSCAWCAPGRFSSEYHDEIGATRLCTSCEPGRSQPNPGQVECDLCKPGYFAEAGLKECKPCPTGTYTNQTGAVSCTSCKDVLPAAAGFTTPSAGTASADKCICAESLYRDARNRGSCLKCKFGMTCSAGSDALGFLPEQAARHPDMPLLNPGFWSSAEEPLSVFRCESTTRCRGGQAGNSCAAKLTSQACAHCAKGFSWSGHACEPCMESGAAYLIFPLLPCMLLPVLVVFIYRLFNDAYAKWDTWRNGVGATLFLLIHHYHIMNVIRETSTAFPPDVKSTFRFFAFFSDIYSLFRVGCYGLGGFTSKLILQSSGPIFLFIAYAATWSLSQLLGRCYPVMKMDLHRTQNGFFSLIFVFFTGVADAALTLFKCADNPNGMYSLIEDRSFLCYKEEWSTMLAIGIFAVLFWCVGLSLVFAYVIWVAPRNFHKPAFQNRWKFLFSRYRPDVHWWALVLMVKGVLMNLGAVLVASGLGQLLYLAAILLTNIVLVASFRPWRHVVNNIADITMHASLSMTCSIMAWIIKDPAANFTASGDQLGTTLFAILSYGAPALVVVFGLLLYWTLASGSARHRKELDALFILDSAFLFCATEEPMTFLHSLCEGDFLSMVKFKEIVQMELAMRRIRSGYSSHELHDMDAEQLKESLRKRSTLVRCALKPRKFPSEASSQITAGSVVNNEVAPPAEEQAPALHEARGSAEKLVSAPESHMGNELISLAGVRTELV